MTGTWRSWQSARIALTSSVLCGHTTASGGSIFAKASPWPCCSRTAVPVLRRAP